ncbi:MAG: hypothetical protein ORN58_05195, partial [Sediminibacterium sp.]|nr:hypothetical protein [Sediminibacterium sp.]
MNFSYNSKRINWITYNALFILALMTIARVGLYIFFKVEILSTNLMFNTFLLGLRYDARYVGILSLCI